MNSTGTRFIGPLCSSMGLTEVQKQLILNRWNMISQHPNGFMAIWQPIYTEFVVNHPHLFPLAIYTNNDELENKVQAEESLSSNLAFKHHLKVSYVFEYFVYVLLRISVNSFNIHSTALMRIKLGSLNRYFLILVQICMKSHRRHIGKGLLSVYAKQAKLRAKIP